MGWLCRVGIGLDVWRCLFRTAVVEWGGACEDFFSCASYTRSGWCISSGESGAVWEGGVGKQHL